MLIGLLEDDLAIQEMLRLVLECAGHEVIPYANAEACLAALQETEAAGGAPRSPDLFMIDLRLPKATSGLTVIETMRVNPRIHSIPIILMTASAFPETQDLERLHVTLLAKPFDIDEVVQMVNELTAQQ